MTDTTPEAHEWAACPTPATHWACRKADRLDAHPVPDSGLREAVAHYLEDHDEGYDPTNLEGTWCDGGCIGVRNLRAALESKP